MESYNNVIQPAFEDVFRKDFTLKGRWKKDFFKNNNPITLELGCGKGEYTVSMARNYPEKNFLGIDIKGARMWVGAKEAWQDKLINVGFLRTRIELIESFFSTNEINEIWITFPDPQIKKRRNKKRLSGSRFLNSYGKFLVKDGMIHLKTDSMELYDYTNKLLAYNNIKPNISTDNLYSGEVDSELLKIKTHYEMLFLKEGKNITYTSFRLGAKELKELPDDQE